MNTSAWSAIRQWGNPLGILVVLGCMSSVVYAAIAGLSRQFVYGQGFTERPILQVLGLFGLAFLCYFAALWAAVRVREGRFLLCVIILSSVAFRAILLFSWPIQEIDVYRYLWDGEVTACGISPFRYSPEQVLTASADAKLPADLRRLVALRDSSPSTATILSRIHFEELPTIYPPVSQAVFAFCAAITPDDTSVFARLVIMKTCFVAFDVATLAVLIGLLRLAGQHLGWAVAYGWCPLVVKEFANSGHLDVVAVFLSMLAIFLLLRSTCKTDRGTLGRMTWAAILLALAVGAKLYPVVLFPLFAAAFIRRLGWRLAAAPTIVFAAVTLVVLWPMLPREVLGSRPQQSIVTNETSPAPVPEVDNAGGNLPLARPQDPSSGLRAFLRRWEINDFLFLLVVENLKPEDAASPVSVWFVVIPKTWREQTVGRLADRLSAKPSTVAFLLTRFITGAVFLGLAIVLAWRAARSQQPVEWLRAAFLTLAWFWLLAPTQNPWYWTWAMPLVAFARGRAWLALSGLAMVYYVRFWLAYHWPNQGVWGTGYEGEQFFDYVVIWLEYGPWFAWLALEWWVNRRVSTPHRSA